MKRYIKGQAELVRHQIFRYSVGGNAATLSDFATLTLMTELLNIHYMFSSAVSYIVGVIISYFLNRCWVFHNRKYDKKRKELAIFFFISLIGFFLTNSILFALTEYLNIYYVNSKIFASILVFFWNFTARKYLLFHHKTPKKNSKKKK